MHHNSKSIYLRNKNLQICVQRPKICQEKHIYIFQCDTGVQVYKYQIKSHFCYFMTIIQDQRGTSSGHLIVYSRPHLKQEDFKVYLMVFNGGMMYFL